MAVDIFGATFDLLSSNMQAMQQSGAQMVQNALPIGLAITGALAAWALMWMLVDWFANGDAADMVLELLSLIFTVSLLVLLFSGGFYLSNQGIKGVATVGMDDLIQRLTGMNPGSSVEQALEVLLRAQESIMMSIWADPATPTGTSPIDTVVNGLNPISLIAALSKLVIKVLVTGLVMGCLVIAALCYLALYAITEIWLLLALIFGPLMLPWILYERLSLLTDSWIRFAMQALFLKLVASILLVLTGQMVGGISQAVTLYKQQLILAHGQGQSVGMIGHVADLIAAVPLILTLLLMILLLWKAESIAQGLVNGNTVALAFRRLPKLGGK